MNVYQRKSYLKLVLASLGLIILLITLLYSNYLAQQLALKEDKEVQLYVDALDLYTQNQDLDRTFGIEADLIIDSKIPIIVEDEYGGLSGRNFGIKKDTNQVFLQRKLEDIIASGTEPILGDGYASKIYYTRTRLYRLITYYPYIQILLVASFVYFGYVAFQRSRKQEQNLVWAGMAKETAHQLGTPISALIAWVETLKMTMDEDSEQQEIVQELRHDISRLELIADRFSKIGSVPELERVNIIESLNESKDYMKRRAPKRVFFEYPEVTDEPVYVNINVHLFHWVIENLIRNSLDAMDGKGTISAHVYDNEKYIAIDLIDTGKGIAPGKFKTIFQPGFSTKTRGWGLGLSLAKRIIKDYHKGKIFVKESVPNKQTIFTIHLPKV